jgi:hypothetical protein
MTDAATIAERYLAVWNETDPARRGALLRQHWCQDAIYVDPLARGAGREEIATLIGAVQDRFPGFRFTLAGAADGYGDRVRFSWSLGSPAEPELVKGTDFVLLEEGRLKAVTGFLDKVPAGG